MGKPSGKALGKRKAPPANVQNNGNKKSKKGSGTTATEPTNGKPQRKADQPKKVKLRDQKIIPVPKTAFAITKSRKRQQHLGSDEEEAEEEQDEDEMIEDLGEDEELEIEGASRFLSGVDEHALSRSKKETKRLHELSKKDAFPKQQRKKLQLPASAGRSGSPSGSSVYEFDSDPEFDSDLNTDAGSEDDVELDDSDLEDSDISLSEEEDEEDVLAAAYDEISDEEEMEEEFHERRKGKKAAKDSEADYETSGRARWTASTKKEEEDDHVEVGRLPIKLPTGEIQQVEGSTRIALPPSKKRKPVQESESEDEEEEEEEDEGSDDGVQAERMAGQKGKFGRMGIAEIVGMKGWKNAQKLESAKEQIAALGAEILAGGELIDNGPVLTRLSTFALPTVPSLEEGKGNLSVPASIRGLAFLSQLAVYKDLIPGYRIRALTELEEAEKVRDEVKRLREGEKMLLRTYKGYLKMLEAEIKARSPLASLSLKCMSELLISATHFNFSENIMGVLVGRVGRKSWDSDADLVIQTFISVFKSDLTGIYSQTLVRLVARMIKERHFQVHPNVLSSLLQLRLRDELDQMRRGKNAKGGGAKKDDPLKGKKFKSEIRKKWATKNQRKREKEAKIVESEMKEAEAEVDKEERAQVQTETLKNLFVLYFSILKSTHRTPLLPAALEGVAAYAHHINIDFFRDLLAVLRRIVVEQKETSTFIGAQAPERGEGEDEEDLNPQSQVDSSQRIRLRLLAIVTAFDLLSGQGEALNIDLGEFINELFGLLRPLSLDTGIEDPPTITIGSSSSKIIHSHKLSTSELLFKSLNASFYSRHIGRSPTYRTSAFAKRLTECALNLPPNSAREAIAFARGLMSKDSKIEGMLNTEERFADGLFKPESDDPQLINTFAGSWWDIHLLANNHWDRLVRAEAVKLRDNKAV